MSKHAAQTAAKKPGAAAKSAPPAGKDEHKALNKQVKGANYAEGKAIVKPKVKHGGKHDAKHGHGAAKAHEDEEEALAHGEAAPVEHDDSNAYHGNHMGIVEKAAAAAKVGGAQYVSVAKPGAAAKTQPSSGGSATTAFAKPHKPDALIKAKHKS